MPQKRLARDGWIIGGTLVSLAALAYSLLRGNRRQGRITSGFAGAFLEEWNDIRLEKRVAALLAKAAAEGKTSPGRLDGPWSRP